MSETDINFLLNKSIRYFSKKRRFFDISHRTAQAIVLLGASSSVTAVFSENSKFALYTTALITIVGTIDYVFDLAGKSRLFDDLYRRTTALTAELIESVVADEQMVARVKSKRYEIYADAPAMNRVLEVVCHNEEVQARGLPITHEYKLTKVQRFFAYLFDLSPPRFEGED